MDTVSGRSPSGRATHEPGLASRPGHSVSVSNAGLFKRAVFHAVRFIAGALILFLLILGIALIAALTSPDGFGWTAMMVFAVAASYSLGALVIGEDADPAIEDRAIGLTQADYHAGAA